MGVVNKGWVCRRGFCTCTKWRSTWHPFLEQKKTSEREREDKEIIKNVFVYQIE